MNKASASSRRNFYISTAIIAGWLPILTMFLSMIRAHGEGGILEKILAGRDFGTFWIAGNMARHSIGNIISTSAIFTPDFFSHILKSHFDFLHGVRLWSYPPTGLFLVLPFSVFGLTVSWITFTMIGIIALIMVLRKTGVWWLGLIAIPAVWDNILAGQNALFTGALSILGIYFALNKDWKAGICFGTMTFKPQLGLVIPGFLLARKSWEIIIISGFIAVVMAVIAAFMWPGSWHEWIDRVMPVQSHLLDKAVKPTASQAYMASAFIFFRWFGLSVRDSVSLQIGITILSCAGAVFLGLKTSGRNKETLHPMRVMLCLLTLESLATPYLLDYDLAAITCLAAAGLWQGWLGNGMYGSLEKLFGYTLIWLPGWNLFLGVGLKIPSIVWMDILGLAIFLMSDLCFQQSASSINQDTRKELSTC